MEGTVDQVGRAGGGIGRSCRRLLACAAHPVESGVAHEALDGAACDVTAVAVEIDGAPHLADAVTGVVVGVDALQRCGDRRIADGPGRGRPGFERIVGARRNARGGVCQCPHDRLDAELLAVVVDEGDDYRCGRSSSAAKKAEARFRISLARRDSANSARSRRFSASRSRDSPTVVAPVFLWSLHPAAEGFAVDAQLCGNPGGRPTGGVGVGLGVEDEFDGACLEFVGVLLRH